MAVTSKPKKKQNRVIQFLSKEYKYENLILAILAIFNCPWRIDCSRDIASQSRLFLNRRLS